MDPTLEQCRHTHGFNYDSTFLSTNLHCNPQNSKAARTKHMAAGESVESFACVSTSRFWKRRFTEKPFEMFGRCHREPSWKHIAETTNKYALPSGTMDSVRAGPFGQLFRPDNFVFGQTGQQPVGVSQHVGSLTGILTFNASNSGICRHLNVDEH